MYAKGFYDGLRQAGVTNPLNLVRTAWAGSQRYAALVWSGDIYSSFRSLREQLAAGLSMAIAGIPWWTTDIGGFIGGNPGSSEFRELLVRWFEGGCFCPVFRLHGDSYLFLRERLRPYLRQLMRAASEQGTSVMRPLFYDFPEDPRAWEVETEYMFGPDLLVAPVMQAGQRTRRLYLPEGATWTSAWTGELYSGGQLIEVDADLGTIPLFLCNGATLPIREKG